MFNAGKQFIPYIKNSICTKSIKNIGALTITFPFGFVNNMLSFKVQLYSYDLGMAEYNIGGYTYDTNRWNYPFALCISDKSYVHKNLPVSFGLNNNNKPTVSIGSINTDWSYTQIVVKDVLSGWIIPSEDIYNNTTIHFETSNLGTVLSVVENPWIGNL